MSTNLSEEDKKILVRQDILDVIALRDKISEKYLEVGIKSIEQMRRWVFEVITISSAIMGVFIVIGSDKPFMRNIQFIQSKTTANSGGHLLSTSNAGGTIIMC